MTSASMICTAADAVGYEINLSWGESRRDMVFYAAASEVAHGKNKPASEKTPAPAICSAAHAVGYEIGLPCTKTMPASMICTAADAVGYESKLPPAEPVALVRHKWLATNCGKPRSNASHRNF